MDEPDPAAKSPLHSIIAAPQPEAAGGADADAAETGQTPATRATAVSPNPPIRICVLGSEAAGKTCFLGGLAILSEPNRDSPIHVIGAESDRDATSGSPSQQFLNNVARTLRSGEWPPPTTLTREIELDLRFRDRLFNFDVIDYPGESFREALNQLDESRQKALIDHMVKADFLLLMLDPDSDLPDESQLSKEQRQQVHERQNAHIAGIRTIYDEAQVSRRALPNIGLVITKADAHPEYQDAEKLIAERGANLLSRIESWGVETRCFATSAVGQLEDGNPPGELAPFGYSQIFDWVVSSTRRNRRGRWIKRVVIPAALVILGGALFIYLQANRAEKIAADPGKPLETRVRGANAAIFASSALRVEVDALVADQLGTMRERFTNLRSTEELKQLRSDFLLLKSLKRTSRGRELAEFGTLLEEGDRKLRLRRIRSMEPGDPELLEISQAFIKDYPAAEEAAEVERIISRIRDINDMTDREKVRRVSVQRGDLDSLNRKAAAIMEYVIAHRTTEESADMERAASVARRLANTNPIRVRVAGGGTFYLAREWELRVFVDNMDQPAAEFPTDGKVRRATWTREMRISNWRPGTKIRLEVEEFRLVNEMVAEIEISDLLSISSLGEKLLLPIRSDFGSQYIDGSHFEVAASVVGFSDDDWKLLQRYVYPGKAW